MARQEPELAAPHFDGRHRRQSSEPSIETPGTRQYDGIGLDLRYERERLGLELDDVAAMLRIQRHYLAAIEEGRYDELPGTTYAFGFLRSYAGLVGLDSRMVTEAFKAESSVRPGAKRLIMPEPIPESRRPRGLAILLSVLVAGAIYAGWAYVSGSEQFSIEQVPTPPDRLMSLLSGGGDETDDAGMAEPAAPPVTEPATIGETVPPPDVVSTPATAPAAAGANGMPAGAGGSETGEQAGEQQAAAAASAATPTETSVVPDLPGSDDPAATGAAPTDAAEPLQTDAPAIAALPQAVPEPAMPPAFPTADPAPGSDDVASTTTTSASAAPGDGPVPQVYGLANAGGDARVVVRASGDSWVQVQGPQDELLLTRILRAGDRYLAPDLSDVVMTTGNAGALEIIVDGRSLGAPGPDGAVIRNIPLDPETLLTVGLPQAR